MDAKFLALLVLTTMNLPGTQATGTLEIKISRWQSGCTDDAGSTAHCDPYFQFCLTKGGTNTCDYGSYNCNQGNHYYNTRVLDFTTDVCGISMPIVKTGITRFDSSPKVKLTTAVWDADTFSDDHLATWSYEFDIFPQRDSASASFNKLYTYGGGHHLWFYYRAYCAADYYTKSCDVYCIASDDVTGHYTCGAATGGKICRPGWTGSSCNVSRQNPCDSNPCYGNATCVAQTSANYTCKCSPLYTGQRCEVQLTLCDLRAPCRNNGTCTGDATSYSCDCPCPWKGQNCEVKVTGRDVLRAAERDEALAELTSAGWQRVVGRDAISKQFLFDDFAEAFGFMTRVALTRERTRDHQLDMELCSIGNTVHVTLVTEDWDGASREDFNFAKAIEQASV